MRYNDIITEGPDRQAMAYYNPKAKWAIVTFMHKSGGQKFEKMVAQGTFGKMIYDYANTPDEDISMMRFSQGARAAVLKSDPNDIQLQLDDQVVDSKEAEERKQELGRQFRAQGYEVFGSGLNQGYWGGKKFSLENWNEILDKVRSVVRDALQKEGFSGRDLENSIPQMLNRVRQNISQLKTPSDVKTFVRRQSKSFVR